MLRRWLALRRAGLRRASLRDHRRDGRLEEAHRLALGDLDDDDVVAHLTDGSAYAVARDDLVALLDARDEIPLSLAPTALRAYRKEVEGRDDDHDVGDQDDEAIHCG